MCACLQDIKAGQVLLHLPLRLAITDHPEDPESNELMYEDAPWSLRLACKLLREKAKASASPWHPYLQVWCFTAAYTYISLRRELHGVLFAHLLHPLCVLTVTALAAGICLVHFWGRRK